MEFTDILYEVDDGFAVITINRPKVMNAFRSQTVDELIEAFKQAWADRSVGAVEILALLTEEPGTLPLADALEHRMVIQMPLMDRRQAGRGSAATRGIVNNRVKFPVDTMFGVP